MIHGCCHGAQGNTELSLAVRTDSTTVRRAQNVLPVVMTLNSAALPFGLSNFLFS